MAKKYNSVMALPPSAKVPAKVPWEISLRKAATPHLGKTTGDRMAAHAKGSGDLVLE
jgi:hypothetical protein